MKKYWKEIIILLVQLFMFYIFPLFSKLDAIGMVLIILLVTFILSIIIASISEKKEKYFYSIIISILFIPSVFIYYNDSALVHIFWYFIDSTIGLLIGYVIYKIINKR